MWLGPPLRYTMMIDLLPGVVDACAFSRSKSARESPPTLSAPTLRKARRDRESQNFPCFSPQTVSISHSPGKANQRVKRGFNLSKFTVIERSRPHDLGKPAFA